MKKLSTVFTLALFVAMLGITTFAQQKIKRPVEGRDYQLIDAGQQASLEAQATSMIQTQSAKATKGGRMTATVTIGGSMPAPQVANVVMAESPINRAISVQLQFTHDTGPNLTIIRFRQASGDNIRYLRGYFLYQGAGPYWNFELEPEHVFTNDELAGPATYGAILFSSNGATIVQAQFVPNPYESLSYGVTFRPVIRNTAFRRGVITADIDTPFRNTDNSVPVSVSLRQSTGYQVLIPQVAVSFKGQLNVYLNADINARGLPPGNYLLTATGADGVSGSQMVYIDMRESVSPTPVTNPAGISAPYTGVEISHPALTKKVADQ